MNLLFVCSQNRLRSPTAEAVFAAYPGIEAISCGTNADAATTLSGDLIDWADMIFVMETTHKNKLSKKFSQHLRNKRVICLAIPDNYDYMEPALVRLLEVKVAPYLRGG